MTKTLSFGENVDELVIEPNRYRLIWGALCPYAHRTRIAREILGLTDVISLGEINPKRSDNGWAFSLDPGKVDPVLQKEYLKDVYLATDPTYEGPYSVPVLVDEQTGKIVRKESANILHDFATLFKPLHKKDAPDLYPKNLASEIDQWNNRIAYAVNDGIYRIGFAKTQEAYEKAYHTFFEMLDELNERLKTRRYIHGNQLTETDIRLYTTLVRFDTVYYILYKANRNRLSDFPYLWDYMRDLYQTPGFGSTTHFDAIKIGYFSSEKIIPLGPDESGWLLPQNRKEQFS